MQAYKELEASGLYDDFYSHLIDWSSRNVLAAVLGKCKSVWMCVLDDGRKNEAIKLCEASGADYALTCVQFSENGEQLAVGTLFGKTQIWDVEAQKVVLERKRYTSDFKVDCLAWNGQALSVGDHLGAIIHWDPRAPSSDGSECICLAAHSRNICGLKWSPDKRQLASSGNDYAVKVWDLRREKPLVTFTEHTGCVKALAWSPHHRGVLTSGGGSGDGHLRFWDTLTGVPLQRIITGRSQMCNVAWSRHSNELVTTHGYPANEIITWKYPELRPVIRQSNYARHLYMAMSPDGESIVTGTDRETIQFWRVFRKNEGNDGKKSDDD